MVVENRSGFKAPEFPQVRSVPGVPQSPRNSSYSLENIGVRHIGRTSLKPGCMSFFFQGGYERRLIVHCTYNDNNFWNQ